MKIYNTVKWTVCDFCILEKDKRIEPPDKDSKIKSPPENDKRQEPPIPHAPDNAPVEVRLIINLYTCHYTYTFWRQWSRGGETNH